jgi:hypothetical protein
MAYRARATIPESAERLRLARCLAEEGYTPAEISAVLVRNFGISARQARRYTGATKARENKLPRMKNGLTSSIIGHVYIVQHIETKMFKIGATSQWYNRKHFYKLNRSCKLIYIHEGLDYRRLEQKLHKALDSYRLPTSEWFFCPESTDFKAIISA